ncbi:MAG: DUF928 domain-containing protein [Elainellaceae cyanobacterium]
MKHAVGRSPSSSSRILLGFTAILCFSLAPQALAQQSVPTPPDQGTPTGRQRGGASRGDCVDYQDLTALVPVVDGVVWSQTQSPTPEFFFYIPEALTADIPLELVVQDSQDNYVFRQQFLVDAPSGILTVPTATAATAGSELTPGEAYSWTFSIYCDAARPSASTSVFGTIQRVADADLGGVESEGDTGYAQASQRTPDMQLELARQYATEGLWHEALGLALSLHQAEPTSAEYLETLESLFQQAGLTDISPTVVVNEVPE